MFKLAKTTLLLSALVISGGAQAQSSNHSPDAMPTVSVQQASVMELQRQARALQQKIGAIQQSALTENPELEEQRAALEKRVLGAMKVLGATPEKDTQRLQTLQEQAGKPGVSQQQRMEIIQEARGIQQGLRQVQQQVMQNEDIQRARQAFSEDLLQAMKDENADTEKLVQSLQQTVQQLRMQQAKRQQQTP